MWGAGCASCWAWLRAAGRSVSSRCCPRVQFAKIPAGALTYGFKERACARLQAKITETGLRSFRKVENTKYTLASSNHTKRNTLEEVMWKIQIEKERKVQWLPRSRSQARPLARPVPAWEPSGPARAGPSLGESHPEGLPQELAWGLPPSSATSSASGPPGPGHGPARQGSCSWFSGVSLPGEPHKDNCGFSNQLTSELR